MAFLRLSSFCCLFVLLLSKRHQKLKVDVKFCFQHHWGCTGNKILVDCVDPCHDAQVVFFVFRHVVSSTLLTRT